MASVAMVMIPQFGKAGGAGCLRTGATGFNDVEMLGEALWEGSSGFAGASGSMVVLIEISFFREKGRKKCSCFSA